MDMQEKALFADAFIYQPSLVKRLGVEFVQASREIRKDPAVYIASAIIGDGIGGHRRRMFLLYGLSVALLMFSTVFIGLLAAYSIAHRHDGEQAEEKDEFIHIANLSDFQQQEIEAPKASQKAGGGGGGGR